MKTRIDYFNLYSEIEKLQVNELKEALMKFPNQEYEFITEEDAENVRDLECPLIIGMESHYSDEPFNMYVTKVCVANGKLEIWGFETENGDYSYQNCYDASDVQRGHLHYIIEELPEPFVQDEKMYTYKEMENAVHLANDLFVDLYEKWGDMKATAEFIIVKAVELEKRLGYKNEGDGDYDYVEELEKFEEEIKKEID